MDAGARVLKLAKGSPSAVVAAGVVALSYVLAFAQRPGRAFTDTRIELTVDPVRFLHAVTSMWSPTGDLGHVQSGQFVGYLVPMAPWYAFAHAIGLPTWVAERIWLGSLLAAAGLGAMVLLRALLPRAAPLAEAVAAVLFLANPYVVVVIGRTSVWLVMYAALPWLLFAVRRGSRNPRGWRWPAVVGLLLCVANGGANVALTFWIVLAPPALLAYEVLVVRSVDWRAAGAFALRAAACSAITSLWWVIPVLLQSRYGTNPLAFTEVPSGILTTPSVSESLRLLGYWLVYYGGASGPSVGSAGTYLFDPVVVVASFLVPLAAMAGFARTRRWNYAPFLMLLAGGAVIAMSLGFPPGSPLNQVYLASYYHSTVLQVLRTTWKAAPLLALPYALLAAVWTETIVRRARSPRGVRVWRLRLPAWTLAALLSLPVLWALPLFDGTAIDTSTAYGAVPSYWRAALHDATRATNTNQRIMILPGELFAWYRWGETITSVAPFLTPRRLTIREADRFSDPRSSQLETAIDDLVQQDRLVPGQLEPLLQLLGVGAVLIPADGDLAGDGALDPADAASALRDQPMFTVPVQSYGRRQMYTPMPGRDGVPVSLPMIRRFTMPSTSPGVVRVHPFRDTTIVDGDGNGIAELAADGMLNPTRAVIYAGDVDSRTLGQLVAAGARLVFTDSSRRRVVSPSSVRNDVGPTLGPGDQIASDTPSYDLFPALGAGGETVSSYSGLSYFRTPGPQRSAAVFPADGPDAAVDGDLRTGWLADAQSPLPDRYLELELNSPRPVASIRIYPLSEQLGITTAIKISVNGGSERQVLLRPGWNTVPINATPLRRLRITVVGVVGFGSAGGIAELQIPGVRVREALRLPTDLATATAGLDLSHNELTILLARTTADFPYREETPPGTLQDLSSLYAADAEHDIRRIVTLPTARAFKLSGWASVSSTASDPLIDKLAHLPAGWQFSSSDRFEGVPINRASSAFDRNPSTAWVAWFTAGHTYPWIQWSSPRALIVHRMRLTPGSPRYEFPNLVRITAPGAGAQDVSVASNGSIVLKRPVHSRVMRLQVLGVRYPIGKAEFDRFLNAVAIGEINVPGLHPPSPRRDGVFVTRCGELSIGGAGHTQRAAVFGTIAALDQGEPLRLRPCGRRRTLQLHAGVNLLVAPAGTVMQPDHLALDSPAPAPVKPGPTPTLNSPGTAHDDTQNGVRPDVSDRSWLVLGESYSSGWRAWCRSASGREYSLGASQPIDGYANGWRIDAACKSARIAFAPQGTANLAYLVSAAATFLLLAIAAGVRFPAGIRRRVTARRAASRKPTPALAPAAPVTQARHSASPLVIKLRPLAALAWALGIGALTGFVFAWRFGAAIGALTVLLLVVGISARGLGGLAMIGTVAIPVLYVARPAYNYGGFSFYFSLHNLIAHWIGAAVVCALIAAAVWRAAELRARTRPPNTHGAPPRAIPRRRSRRARESATR